MIPIPRQPIKEDDETIFEKMPEYNETARFPDFENKIKEPEEDQTTPLGMSDEEEKMEISFQTSESFGSQS